MELDPKTEAGKRLNTILNDWIQMKPQDAVDTLKRVFLMYSPKIINEDSFIVALYGQHAVDEPPLDLRKELTTCLLRVQHAIAAAICKRRFKELVVALEWSENDEVLTEILRWAGETPKKDITEAMKVLSIDLAPVRVVRTISSLFSPGSVGLYKPREREIVMQGGKTISGILNYEKKVIVICEWFVEIYSSTDLQRETVLPYYKGKTRITCLQCTPTEIIASYDDGKICVWNIESGILVQEVSVRNESNTRDSVRCMRLKKPKLVVVTDSGMVMIWQYVNTSLKILGSWKIGLRSVIQLDFDENYVVLLGHPASSVNVYHWNGAFARTISIPGHTCNMAYYNGHVITGGTEKSLRVWDAKTGKCLKELGRHTAEIEYLYACNDCIVSGDANGGIIIWNIESALTDRHSASICVRDSNGASPKVDMRSLRLGRYFLAVRDMPYPSNRLTVIDQSP